MSERPIPIEASSNVAETVVDLTFSSWLQRHRLMVWLMAGLPPVFYAALLMRAYPTVLGGSPMFLQFTLDDAYMYLRYADNFLGGKGVAWNPDGVQTYGVTSLPYLLGVTAFRPIPMPGGLLLMVLSWAFGALFHLTIAVTCLLAVKSRTLKSFPLLVLLAAAPVIWHQTSRTHALTGMDTTLSTLGNALLILGVVFFVKQPSASRFALMCVGAFCSYSIRPDNALYATLFPLATLLWLVRDRAYLWKFVAVMTALIAADLLVKDAIFGYALPLSAYVKRSAYYAGFAGVAAWNPVGYLGEFGRLVLPYLWVLVLFSRAKHARFLAAYLVPVVITFLYYFTVIQIMGVNGRFYYPALPFVIVAAIFVLDDAITEGLGTRRFVVPTRRVLVAAFLSIGLFVAPPYLARLYAATVFGQLPDASQRNRALPQLGGWKSKREMGAVARQLPAGTLMAATEVGYLGAMAPQVGLIDLAGLNDNHLAHHGFSVTYLIDRQPDLIWFPFWTYVNMIDTILKSDSFWDHYDYFCEAYDYGIAVRKDSPVRLAILDELGRNWPANYGQRPMRTCGPSPTR